MQFLSARGLSRGASLTSLIYFLTAGGLVMKGLLLLGHEVVEQAAISRDLANARGAVQMARMANAAGYDFVGRSRQVKPVLQRMYHGYTIRYGSFAGCEFQLEIKPEAIHGCIPYLVIEDGNLKLNVAKDHPNPPAERAGATLAAFFAKFLPSNS